MSFQIIYFKVLTPIFFDAFVTHHTTLKYASTNKAIHKLRNANLDNI